MLSNENKTIPAFFREFIATIETLIEKTCIQEMSREKILPTSTVSPSLSSDVHCAKITPIPYWEETRRQGTPDTVEYCDMV